LEFKVSEIIESLKKAVAQQLLSPQTPYVKKAYDRIIELGLSKHAAIEEIADCLGEETDMMLHEKRGFDEKNYCKLLNALPWKKSTQQTVL
jgi:hypothetical protein